MEKKFEIFNVYPYGNETIENVITAHDWQALKYVSHLTLNNEDMTLDRAKLLYELSQALIMNNVQIVLQRVDNSIYVCMQYEIRTDNGTKRSGLRTLWEDRNEYGYVPADKDKQFEILSDCLAYIKSEIEPQKEHHAFICGHCGKEYTELKLRTLMGKPVCEECLKVVCPICGERKKEFVITPCGSYSRICKECYDKNPNGYELCDGCSDKPYCKGKLVDLGELYDVGEERLCEQVAQIRSDIKKCSCCGNYEEVDNFIGDTCFACIKGSCLFCHKMLTEKNQQEFRLAKYENKGEKEFVCLDCLTKNLPDEYTYTVHLKKKSDVELITRSDRYEVKTIQMLQQLQKLEDKKVGGRK